MTHVALSARGRYLRVGTADGETRVRADGPAIDSDAVLERVPLRHGRIALRTLGGQYVAHAPDRGLSFGLYLVDELTPAAAFEEILWPDDRVSLRSCALTFVSATPEQDGRVSSNRVTPGENERLRLVHLPDPVIPAQRRTGAEGHPDAPQDAR